MPIPLSPGPNGPPPAKPPARMRRDVGRGHRAVRAGVADHAAVHHPGTSCQRFRHLRHPDSMVALVGAALDGGASVLLPAHYGPASTAERGRIFASLTLFALLGASVAGLLLIFYWSWHHSIFVEQSGHLIIAITAVLMPLRVLTAIAMMSFTVTGRSFAIAMAGRLPVRRHLLQHADRAVRVFDGRRLAVYRSGLQANWRRSLCAW